MEEKILKYEIMDKDLIITYKNKDKIIINNFNKEDLENVFLNLLYYARKDNNLAKEKQILIEILTLNMQSYSLEELRTKCFDLDLIPDYLIFTDDIYLENLMKNELIEKPKVKNKTFIESESQIIIASKNIDIDNN